MGWKCPNCRRHVYKAGKCPYCSDDVCEICGAIKSPSDIHEHHISYDLDVTVQACDECHTKIHFPEERGPNDNDVELDRLNPLAADGGDSRV